MYLFARLNSPPSRAFFTECRIFALVKFHIQAQISRDCIASWSVHFCPSPHRLLPSTPGPIEAIEVMPPGLRNQHPINIPLKTSPAHVLFRSGQGEGRQLDFSDFRNRNIV